MFIYSGARGELKRRRRRRRTYRSVPANLGNRLVKVEKKVRAIELKFNDTNSGSLQPVTIGTFFLMNGIGEGSGGDEREGIRLSISSVQYRLSVSAFVAGDKNQVRLLIVQDRQPNGAIFAIGDLLADGTAIDAIVSPYNMLESHRFNVLVDKTINVNESGPASVLARGYKKCNIQTIYNFSSGAITSISTNTIHALVIGLNTEADYILFTRIRYLDG